MRVIKEGILLLIIVFSPAVVAHYCDCFPGGPSSQFQNNYVALSHTTPIFNAAQLYFEFDVIMTGLQDNNGCDIVSSGGSPWPENCRVSDGCHLSEPTCGTPQDVYNLDGRFTSCEKRINGGGSWVSCSSDLDYNNLYESSDRWTNGFSSGEQMTLDNVRVNVLANADYGEYRLTFDATWDPDIYAVPFRSGQCNGGNYYFSDQTNYGSSASGSYGCGTMIKEVGKEYEVTLCLYECASSGDCGGASCDFFSGDCDSGGTCSGPCTDTCTTEGYECGTQTICGSSTDCGSCGSGENCQSGTCVPDCTDTCTTEGYECGTHTICGSSTDCGSCETWETCNSGTCECTDTCTTESYECGTHTICGSSQNCGSCGTGEVCSAGQCVTSCTDTCTSLSFECGTHDICGSSTSCGTCGTGETCSSGQCVASCTDTCTTEGFECGTQTICGSSTNCGTCETWETCNSGTCECTDTCTTESYECGTHTICDSSQNCGSCGTGEVCSAGQCVTNCVDTCTSLSFECGTHDICGTSESCGTCGTGETCNSGTCECVPDCTGKSCGTDGCGGNCGTCETYEQCDAQQQCILMCVDSCSVIGSASCVDDEIQTCVDNDADPCYEWEYTDCAATGDICQSAACVDPGCSVATCGDDDGCCPSGCDYSQDTDCDLDCTDYTSQSSCDAISLCGWCPMNSECMEDRDIDCTASSCNSASEYCTDNCQWRECFNTKSSCYCQDGTCNSCNDGEACERYTCEQLKIVQLDDCRGISCRDTPDTTPIITRTRGSTPPEAAAAGNTRTTRTTPSTKTEDTEEDVSVEDTQETKSNILYYVIGGIVASIIAYAVYAKISSMPKQPKMPNIPSQPKIPPPVAPSQPSVPPGVNNGFSQYNQGYNKTPQQNNQGNKNPPQNRF